jgi:hypothetical protein
MPKQEASPIERFHVVTEHEKEYLGEHMALLSRHAIKVISCELVTDVVTYKGGGRQIGTVEFLTPWVAEHPTFGTTEAVAHGRADGRNPSAVYAALNVMVKNGVLKRVGKGEYARADQKALPAPDKPEKTTKATKPAKQEKEYHSVDHREFILRYARQHNGRMTVTNLRTHFEKHGRRPTSVGGALNYLKVKKQIKLLGNGEYVLLSKVTPAKKPVTKKKPNGGDHVEMPVAVEVTNG